MSIDINAIADLSIDGIRTSAMELAKLKGWNVGSAKGLIRCLPMIIREVEKLGKLRDLTGQEKNELAVVLLLKFIKLPWWLPMGFIKPLLEGMVSAIVDALKETF